MCFLNDIVCTYETFNLANCKLISASGFVFAKNKTKLKDIQKQRYGFQMAALKLSNGYVLPEGKLTPNTLFVGGIDMKVSGVFFKILLNMNKLNKSKL